MSIRSVTPAEMAGLLSLYGRLDDLARDVAGSTGGYAEPLAELRGMVKSLGTALPGISGGQAFLLEGEGVRPVVVESDGTIFPKADWEKIAASQGIVPGAIS